MIIDIIFGIDLNPLFAWCWEEVRNHLFTHVAGGC